MDNHPSEWSEVTLESPPAPEPSFPSIQAGPTTCDALWKMPISSERKHSGQLLSLLAQDPSHFGKWPPWYALLSWWISQAWILPFLPTSGWVCYPVWAIVHVPSPLYPDSPANDWFSRSLEAQQGPIEMKASGDCCSFTAWRKPITNRAGHEIKK